MSGHWPPEWEDPGEEFPEQADQLDAAAEARLSEVAAFLASVPAPALPDAVEARIGAALAAEVATRADHAAPADGSRKLAPARARVGRHRGGGGPRRGFRVRPQVVGGSLVTCLLLAGLGFGLSHAGSSSSSSSAASGSAAEPAEASGTAASSAAAGGSSAAGPAVPGPQRAGPGSSFVVSMSGTRYQQATLAEQVRSRLPADGGQGTYGTTTVPTPRQTVPGASASSASAAAGPGAALRGCVFHLTGGVLPRLVDRATYQGEPAYIIASPSRVWVVGLGCTAAKTEVVTSVPLAGLPGIFAP